MRNQFIFFSLLLILIILDAWLLAHPNLLGKIGVWIYKYSYLKTFPRALGTVVLLSSLTLLLTWLIKHYFSLGTAKFIMGILLAGTTYILIQTIVQFSGGTYAHTGAGFKTGAILLPFILIIIVVKNLVEVFLQKESSDSGRDGLKTLPEE
ncbi:hypothetical protein QNI19_05665 [Cytophagaceae bacterium DM2B3-1]|uniref:DUF4293 domain-containing protein n=1 Tax=Xanthocytophaga flava TaxID=3048013 RepID=A0ABT7CF94_9BACT|nr:hypothetical protein [Xanthocytophaga flavus]MDJ1472914.1 hypothetical protein [Xanthocytophaga flavus]MDJ1492407.1 hypothetical protein [Xanthocytophaga flavus]